MDLFSKCDHIRNFLRICSHLLKKIPLKKVKVKVNTTCYLNSHYQTRENSKILKKNLFQFYQMKHLKNTASNFIYLLHCVKVSKYGVFFWSVFCYIRTEYGEIQSISAYSVRMRVNTVQKNSVSGHFSSSASLSLLIRISSELRVQLSLETVILQ